MGVFRYRAARPDGSIEEGLIELADRAEAISMLRGRGLLPVEVQVSRTMGYQGKGMPAADLAIGLRTLATLLDAGLPLARALAAFDETAPASWSRAVPTVRERIRQGDGLGAALEQSKVGIPRLLTSVIRAGEAGSGLSKSVRRAADLAESRAQLKNSVRAALSYPALLLVVGAASIGIIVAVVLPRFASIIADVGGDVPPLASRIMAAATLLRTLFIPALVAAAGGVILWRLWSRDPAARVKIDQLLLTIPIVGELRLCAASSSGCAALGALLEGGVPIAGALTHSARATGDWEIERRTLLARDRVIGGARLSAALVEQKAITATASRLIRAGEESGQLPQMLERAAAIDLNRLNESLRAGVRLLEPAMIIGFAAIIAVVSGALLQTVYAIKP